MVQSVVGKINRTIYSLFKAHFLYFYNQINFEFNMLIPTKTSIKTTLLLLLFTIGGTYWASGSSILKNQPKNPASATSLFSPEQFSTTATAHFFIFDPVGLTSPDTVKTENSTEFKELKAEEFIIPARFAGNTFDFQVNSAISYYSFSHFVKNESKKIFFQAWLKEKELNRITSHTDSLRKVYANASSEQKDEISGLILKNEDLSLALNQEIPDLYQKFRDLENQYWQTASPFEVYRFQEKIQLFKDSIRQTFIWKKEQTTTISQKIPDTLHVYKSSQKNVINTDFTSGIIYKIQVGAFRGKLPDNAAKSIKKLSLLRKVEKEKDEKGITIYSTGNLKSYQEALIMQEQVKQEGMKNPTVTAFHNGNLISVNEARKLNNEL